MKSFIIALKILLLFTILTGIIYPLLITGIAQLVFPDKANGSLIIEHNRVIGSELIGQYFDSNIYFTSRPSATSYNPLPSSGSNLGLTNKKLIELVSVRKQQFVKFNELESHTVIPSEMLFESASGLDPHISPKAALLQVERISRARKFDTTQKQNLLNYIDAITEMPQLLCLGEKRINVLKLNLELDHLGNNNQHH